MVLRPAVSPEHADAVTRVVRHMRADPGAPHPLAELAGLAMLSPSHFHRTFRRVTETTPARFLTAVRMAAAKRLLAETDLTVTAVRARVGYASLGTFTTQFTRLVGASPGAYRRAVDRVGGLRVDALLDPAARDALLDPAAREALLDPAAREALLDPAAASARGGAVFGGARGTAHGDPAAASAARGGTVLGGVRGTVLGGPARSAVLVTGLFAADLPQGPPAGCALAPAAGGTGLRVELGAPADGDYRAFTVCLDGRTTVVAALCADVQEHVGWASAPVRVRGGTQTGVPFEVRLRAARAYDPPLVLAVPLLFALGRAGA